MGQPVVLPKFELPGDRPHWAVRVAWITGGLLVASVLVLGLAIWNHRSEVARLEIAKIEAAAKAKAEVEAKAAMAAAAARAAQEAELRAKQAQAVPATTLPAAGGAEGTAQAPSGKITSKRRSGRSSAKVAKVDSSAKGRSGSATASRPSGPKKPDAIDELLSKMGK